MSIAQPSDVQSRLGRELTPEDTILVTVRLNDAERMLSRFANLPAKDQEDVKQVEAEMVLRLVRNPEGYASERDGTYGYTFNQAMASGELELTARDLAILGVVKGTGFVVLEPVHSQGPTRAPWWRRYGR
jgi:hypothetical protein